MMSSYKDVIKYAAEFTLAVTLTLAMISAFMFLATYRFFPEG